MGPSGSGKTTLLNCVATIDRPTSGSIRIDGREVTGLKGKALSRFRRERLGFIFQDCNLLDTLTAFENIALALTILRTPAGEIRPRVEEMAALLGISDCLDKYPYQMSGGQQQRAAAARAMVTRPALILADEPTGALDSRSAGMLLERLEALNRERGATILMVTHDAFTASCCHRVVFLRDGAIFQTLDRGSLDRRAFFARIIQIVTELGGEMADVL
jgi:putative ABC transport system ATP-binding protein